jgi:hypothetical protein
MAKKSGMTLHELSDATGRGAARSHNDVAVQPGHGHSRLSLQDELAKRGSAREATLPSPANPGQRLDAAQPSPVTRHVKSNTTKGAERFHAGHGDTHGGFNETERQAMDRALTGKAPTADAPVPISGRQLPHPDLMDKPSEVAYEERRIGSEPNTGGVLDR